MRFYLWRSFLTVVGFCSFVTVYTIIDEVYLPSFSPDVEGKSVRARTVRKSMTTGLNSSDDLNGQQQEINVDSYPHQNEFANEMLTSERSKTFPVMLLPSMKPTLLEGPFYKSKSADEIARLQNVVDSIPEMSLPSQLTFGFELLTSDRSKSSPVLPSMEPVVAEALYYKYIRTLQIKCPQKTRIGRVEDGGWDACIAGPFNITAPCLVYSIGMGGEWSFDEMITDKKYECLDMAYDPTLGKKDHKPKELLWFYNTGLGISNMVNSKQWKMRTFGKLLEENGHVNTTVYILKIDIEYAEWESLEAILREGSLRKVKQLMVEFHTMESNQGVDSSVLDYVYYSNILRGLDKLGFKTWHYLPTGTGHFKSVHTGAELPCCANVYFVNTALL